MSFFLFRTSAFFQVSYLIHIFYFFFTPKGGGWFLFFRERDRCRERKIVPFHSTSKKKKYQARRFSSSSWVAYSFRTSNEKQFVGADSFVMDWPCKEMADDRFTSLTAFNLQDRFDGRKKGRFIKIIFIFKSRIFFYLFSRVFFFSLVVWIILCLFHANNPRFFFLWARRKKKKKSWCPKTLGDAFGIDYRLCAGHNIRHNV